jgi:hypothetical protein
MILYSEPGVAYRHFSGVALPPFATNVMNGVHDHPVTFDPLGTPALPSTKAHFLQVINTAQSTYSEYDMGGKFQKPAFDTGFKALVDLLDLYAIYVKDIAKGVTNDIVLSGFTPVHSVAPVKAIIPHQAAWVAIANGDVSGVLDAECETFGAGHHYGCIACEGHQLPDNVQILPTGILVMPANVSFRIFHNFTNSRKKVFNGLVKGTEYYFYYYVSNSAGVSVLSVVVSKMCS